MQQHAPPMSSPPALDQLDGSVGRLKGAPVVDMPSLIAALVQSQAVSAGAYPLAALSRDAVKGVVTSLDIHVLAAPASPHEFAQSRARRRAVARWLYAAGLLVTAACAGTATWTVQQRQGALQAVDLAQQTWTIVDVDTSGVIVRAGSTTWRVGKDEKLPNGDLVILFDGATGQVALDSGTFRVRRNGSRK